MKIALGYLALYLGMLALVYALPFESVERARSQLELDEIVLGAALGAIGFGFTFGLQLKDK